MLWEQRSRDVTLDNEITMSFSNEAPVACVGKYLSHLCSDSSVKKYFLYSRSQPSTAIGGKELLPVSVPANTYIFLSCIEYVYIDGIIINAMHILRNV